MTCSPTTLTHLFVYSIALTFALLATWALLIAGWRYVRLGRALMAECGWDVATAWAEVRGIAKANDETDKRIRAAMQAYGVKRGPL